MTRYPTVEETVAVHAKLIARFGGSAGVRDRAALESALARPRSGYCSDLIQEAAALWESLSQNHAFVDGNKRVAVTMTAAFLQVNWNSTTPTRFRFCGTSTRQAECGSKNLIDGSGNTPQLPTPPRRGALSPAALRRLWRTKFETRPRWGTTSVEEFHSANTSCSVLNVEVSVFAETIPSFCASLVLSTART